jgi:hypothetical protein
MAVVRAQNQLAGRWTAVVDESVAPVRRLPPLGCSARPEFAVWERFTGSIVNRGDSAISHPGQTVNSYAGSACTQPSCLLANCRLPSPACKRLRAHAAFQKRRSVPASDQLRAASLRPVHNH